jgi:hypothetical protein
MNISLAKAIIKNAVVTTQSRWTQYSESWKEIDTIFILRGFEQQGFQLFKMKPLLEENRLLSINSLGEIMTKYPVKASYERSFAGSITSEFYIGLLNGLGGKEGKLFAGAVQVFLNQKVGSPGKTFWRLLYHMLQACKFLKEKYESSFAKYIIEKYSLFSTTKDISEDDFLHISVFDWAFFINKVKPWSDLKGIGPNVFDFVLGDIVEAQFVKDSFKFDSSNQHFFHVTGISSLIEPFNKETTCLFLKQLDLSFNLREINKGIYTYCSMTENNNFGFCRNRYKCGNCKVNNICDKNII